MLNLSKQDALRTRYRALRPGYKHGLEMYRAWLDEAAQSGTTLLDIGCGPGGLVRPYVARGVQVMGVDRYASHFHEPAEISAIAEAENSGLPFADNTFDVITCSWVLEHLRDPNAVFGEAARVLKPGGVFLFITPNKHNYVVWLRRLLPNAVGRRATRAVYARDEDFINPTYYRANSFREIDEGLRRVGLRCAQFEAIGDPTYLAFNEFLFRVSILIERFIDKIAPKTRVHLVGMYRK